jgi:hypothetical protein
VEVRRRPALIAVAAAAILAVGGCRIPENALDGPLAIPLRITATPETVEVDAPTWYAAKTAIYLCSTEPPPLPEPGPERIGWTPGTACHDFGEVGSPDGLRTTLPLEQLSDEDLAPFIDAKDWFVLLVKIEGDRAAAAIHSSFPGPIRAAT